MFEPQTTNPRKLHPKRLQEPFLLVYDAWNRLAKVQTDASTPATIATLVYDAVGRRIEKTIANSGDWNCTCHF